MGHDRDSERCCWVLLLSRFGVKLYLGCVCVRLFLAEAPPHTLSPLLFVPGSPLLAPPWHCGILHACGRASDSHATAPFSASWHGDWESACSQNILECVPALLGIWRSSGPESVCVHKSVCVCVLRNGGEETGKQINAHTLTLWVQPLPLWAATVCTCSTPTDAQAHSVPPSLLTLISPLADSV